MQVLYLNRRLRSHQRILNISRMRVNTYENNWDECIPNVKNCQDRLATEGICVFEYSIFKIII